jgi:hypothetical protein
MMIYFAIALTGLFLYIVWDALSTEKRTCVNTDKLKVFNGERLAEGRPVMFHTVFYRDSNISGGWTMANVSFADCVRETAQMTEETGATWAEITVLYVED